MADLNGFDANDVEPREDFNPIPAGKHVGAIVGSETKQNKAGTGSFLQLTLQIIAGEYANRLVWDRLNLDNPNPTAVQIARETLSAICRAVDVPKPNDSVDLHNIPLVINVACRKRADTGDIVNEVKGYAKRGPSKETSASTAPWMR